MTTPHPKAPMQVSPQNNSGLAIASLVLGIISIISFTGFILGVPAIILGAIALKKGNSEKGMSIAGIITGAISTILSLILLGIFFIIFILVAADNTQEYSSPDHQPDYQMNESVPRSNEI